MLKIITNIEKELGNFIHLSPPEMRDENIKLILNKKGNIDIKKQYVPWYEFDIIEMTNNDCVGRIFFRVALTKTLINYGGHIAYGIEPKYHGNKYAAKSIKILIPLIKLHDINEILITCDPKNIASRKTCEIAGAKLENISKNVEIEPNVFRDTCRYVIKI